LNPSRQPDVPEGVGGSPPARSLLVLGYPDVYHAGDHIMEVLEARPIGLEGVEDRLVDDMRKMPNHPETLKLLTVVLRILQGHLLKSDQGIGLDHLDRGHGPGEALLRRRRGPARRSSGQQDEGSDVQCSLRHGEPRHVQPGEPKESGQGLSLTFINTASA
jgi:hypothetical protein